MNPPRVIVVDDETMLVEPLARYLKMKGCAVDLFDDSERALAALAGGTYDVGLFDINMPSVSGIELATRARAHHDGIRIIFMTGDIDQEQIATRTAGLAHYSLLQKPFDLATLLALIFGKG